MVVLRLVDTEKTRKLWDFKFVLDIGVHLIRLEDGSVSFKQTMTATNTSDKAFSFTTALHTYYAVSHVNKIAITPLHQHQYWDKVSQSAKVQEDPLVTISGETDRVYHKYVTCS